MNFKKDPVLMLINLLSKKWNYQILKLLMNRGDCRYSDFEEVYPEISSKMLSLRLKELYETKLISKVISNITPLEFKYRLSENGEHLRRLFIEMGLVGNQLFDGIMDENVGYKDMRALLEEMYL